MTARAGDPSGTGPGAGAGTAGVSSAPAVALRDIRFAYPDGHRALDGLTLTIEPGERVAVLGPNGAGKSTLCLHLNGILRAGAGEVRVGGRPVTADMDRDALLDLRRRVGLVFQDPDDMLFMPTVAEDVAFGPLNLGLPRPEVETRVDRALDAVGMRAVRDRPPHHLSLGQRKRVAIAAVLASQPDVLVCDEPSASLDPRGRRELGAVLDALDLTLLLVTHDLPFALERCDRAVIVDDGRVVADGPIRKLLADAALLAAHALELPAGFDPAAVPDRPRPAAPARTRA